YRGAGGRLFGTRARPRHPPSPRCRRLGARQQSSAPGPERSAEQRRRAPPLRTAGFPTLARDKPACPAPAKLGFAAHGASSDGVILVLSTLFRSLFLPIISPIPALP